MKDWKVTQNFIGEKVVYAVYRVKNINEPLHSGNMEFATGYMESEIDAQDLANKMNNFNLGELKNEKD